MGGVDGGRRIWVCRPQCFFRTEALRRWFWEVNGSRMQDLDSVDPLAPEDTLKM